jgi:hypothetical protein
VKTPENVADMGRELQERHGVPPDGCARSSSRTGASPLARLHDLRLPLRTCTRWAISLRCIIRACRTAFGVLAAVLGTRAIRHILFGVEPIRLTTYFCCDRAYPCRGHRGVLAAGPLCRWYRRSRASEAEQ